MEKKKLIAISALLMGSVVAKAQQATVAGGGDVKNAILNLSIKDFKSKTMYYQLYDVTGRQVKEAKILDALTPIDFQSAASANYVLSVFDQGKMLKSFKIAKNN